MCKTHSFTTRMEASGQLRGESSPRHSKTLKIWKISLLGAGLVLRSQHNIETQTFCIALFNVQFLYVKMYTTDNPTPNQKTSSHLIIIAECPYCTKWNTYVSVFLVRCDQHKIHTHSKRLNSHTHNNSTLLRKLSFALMIIMMLTFSFCITHNIYTIPLEMSCTESYKLFALPFSKYSSVGCWIYQTF